MCDKCNQIDRKIERYRTLSSRITDQLTIDGIAKLVEELLAEKFGLHPEIHLVRVIPDNGRRQFWQAATDRDEALDRVLDVIPEGWAASLEERRLSADHMAELDKKPGEVRRYQVS